MMYLILKLELLGLSPRTSDLHGVFTDKGLAEEHIRNNPEYVIHPVEPNYIFDNPII